MEAERWRRLQDVFATADELPPDQRARFLQESCGDDPALLAEVSSLLDNVPDSEFLESTGIAQRIQESGHSAVTTALVSPVTDPQANEPESFGEYKILHTLGHGGMGVVYLAEQENPRRTVALKVIKLGMDTKEVLARFEAERQALALMNHPNIARVYGAGTTDEGRPYFVMEHVPGVPITEYCARHELSTRERIELFISLCEGVQHAHQKGVIHRDIKPTNVLVHAADEGAAPKVIDFGVAKATGQRLTERTLFTEQGQLVGTPEYMSPEQAEMTAEDIDTRSDVYSLGVLLYELLVGERPFSRDDLMGAGWSGLHRVIRELDPPKPSTRLAQLGSGTGGGERGRSGDPRTLVRELRGDLDWIVMKALEKSRARRYGSAASLAEDLQRHLDYEPVHAGPPSAIYRLSKLVRRNRPLVLAVALVLIAAGVGAGTSEMSAALAATTVAVLLLAGLAGMASLLRLAQRQRAIAEEQRQVAEDLGEQAKQRLEEVLRLSDVKRLAQLAEEADALWPALPEQVLAMEEWLKRARGVAERATAHEQSVAELRSIALPYDDDAAREDFEQHPDRAACEESERTRERLAVEIDELRHELDSPVEPPVPDQGEGPHTLTQEERRIKLAALIRHDERLATEVSALRPTLTARRTWRFVEAQDQWRHDVQTELVERLAALRATGVQGSSIAAIEARRLRAREIEEQSISSPAAQQAWQEALADIAQLPTYKGLRLEPQIGLLPLARNPKSGLWEFWHIASGAAPIECSDEANQWRVEEATGLVLVLLPGGRCWLGAQSEDATRPNYDPLANENEGPPDEVELGPFFLSRCLMTQGQWLAITGKNPSRYGPDSNFAGKQHDLRHPVEQISWSESRDVLRRLDLVLPTEAQWEYAARGGSSTSWWSGAEARSLMGVANVADQFCRHNGGPATWSYEEWSDGYVTHSPVDAFAPNPFGLHDVHGNVREWCADRFGVYGLHSRKSDTGEWIVPGENNRVPRGGSFYNGAADARSAFRYGSSPEYRFHNLGVRPARLIR